MDIRFDHILFLTNVLRERVFIKLAIEKRSQKLKLLRPISLSVAQTVTIRIKSDQLIGKV
ncbi:hypothetical protein DUV48_23210 [Salmonella enterica subsp. enterica]|nr:hypothetical protein [Salmonella enterica subsp. enterica]